MGYDLHITRKKDWAREGEEITAEAWLAYVGNDEELTLSPQDGPHFVRWKGASKYPDAWLDWRDGNIYSKNPGEPLIDKMVRIAEALGAQLQGDDGEIYRSGHEAPERAKASFVERARNWVQKVRARAAVNEIVPEYQVGDRVRDAYGKEALVVEIDGKANHGLGRVRVKYDDGRELAMALAASGLSRVEGDAKE